MPSQRSTPNVAQLTNHFSEFVRNCKPFLASVEPKQKKQRVQRLLVEHMVRVERDGRETPLCPHVQPRFTDPISDPLPETVVVNTDDLLTLFPSLGGGLVQIKNSCFCPGAAIASALLSLAVAASTKPLLDSPHRRASLRQGTEVGMCTPYRAQAEINYEAGQCVGENLPPKRLRFLMKNCRVGSFTSPGAQGRTLDVTVLVLPLDAKSMQRFHMDCRRLLSLISRAYHSLWLTTSRG